MVRRDMGINLSSSEDKRSSMKLGLKDHGPLAGTLRYHRAISRWHTMRPKTEEMERPCIQPGSWMARSSIGAEAGSVVLLPRDLWLHRHIAVAAA